MLFISMFETLIDRNEHNDSGGYKDKYDVEIDRFAVYKQHVSFTDFFIRATKSAAR